MAIQTLPGGLWLPSYTKLYSGVPTLGSTLIDAADEGLAVMLHAPKTGNISKVLWATRTVTTGAIITVRGETWSEAATPATPSGTLFHANFTGTSVIAGTDDNLPILTSLSAAVAVTIGDKLAIVIKNPNTSFGNLNIARFLDDEEGFPFLVHNTGVSPAVSWASVGDCGPVIGLEYDDGSYAWIPGCLPFNAITTTTFNNSDTPDEIGLRFKVPFPCRVNSCWLWIDADGDFNVNLYDSDGATKLISMAVDKDARKSIAAHIQMYRFATTATLLANTYYRLVIEPTSATSLSVYDFAVNAAAVMDAHEGGQSFHMTSAKDPNEESDWTNTTNRRPFMGIGMDGFDDGTPIGILRNVGMSGGLI